MVKRHGGTNAKRRRMRCSRGKKGCGCRFTLRKDPTLYVRPVRCPWCKSMHVIDIEDQRRREQQKQNTCYCFNYPFPHRAGSLRMCTENPDISELTDEEKDDYRRCMATSRSSAT